MCLLGNKGATHVGKLAVTDWTEGRNKNAANNDVLGSRVDVQMHGHR